MKRKLSLMLALMMVLTLIPVSPSFAATGNRIDRVVTAGSSEDLSKSVMPKLVIKNDKKDLSPTTPEVFELKLGPKASWNKDIATKVEGTGSAVGVTGVRLTDDILQVTIPAGSEKDDEVTIEMAVTLDGAEVGPQEVEILSKNSAVSAGKFVYANVGNNDITMRVNSVKKVSRASKDNVLEIIFDEVVRSAFKVGDKFQLRLPKGYEWTKIDDINSKSTGIKANSIDGRILDLEFTKATDGQLDSAYLKAEITIDRDTPFEKIDVTVNGKNTISPRHLEVAEHVGYDVKIEAKEVLEVIAGKDTSREYEAEITLTEQVENAIIDNRYIEVSFVDKDGKDAPAVVQAGENVEITKGGLETVSASNNADKTARATEVNNRGFNTKIKGENVYSLSEWDLRALAKNTEKKHVMEVPFVVDAGYEGDLYLKFDGAGIDNQLVKIAEVKPAVTIEVAKALTQVQIGLQKQSAADIKITETKAGALQDYTETGDKTANYTLQPEEDWFTFKSVKGEVTKGDLQLEEVKTAGKDTAIRVEVARRSTEPSTIELTDMTVTLNRTIPYGDVKLNANFGLASLRHDVKDTTKALDYFTTITPVSDAKRVVTVFTLGEKSYSEKINNNVDAKAMDVAPYAKSGSTMLPIRFVGNAVGATTEWNQETSEVTITKDNTVVSINIYSDTMYVNGSPVKMAQKPDVLDGRTFLPLKSIAQAFGLQTDVSIFWHQGNGTVTILPQDATQAEIDAAKAGTILEVK